MRYAVEFLLTLVYELSDQVRRTHSFIFIHDLVDVSTTLAELPPRQAVARVMAENPPGYYSTDLGNSLHSFSRDHMRPHRQPHDHPLLRRRAQQLQRPAPGYRRRHAAQGQTFSSGSAPSRAVNGAQATAICGNTAWSPTRVFLVNNLRQLAESVDRLLADG